MSGIDQPRGVRRHAVSLGSLLGLSLLAVSLCGGEISAQAAPRPTENGVVKWHALLTEDAEAATAFYSDLFGWQVERTERGKYLITHDGALIGGITEIQRPESGVDDSTWLLGITVPDVKRSVSEARRRGAKILTDASHAEGLGDWAVIEDPQGAQVLLFSPELVLGGDDGPGSWAWAELWTTEPDAAFDFYHAVIGWDGGTWDRPDGAYPVFMSGKQARAGVVDISQEEWRPGWAPYVGVVNLHATLERARQLGGQILFAPDPKVDGGLVAAIADPTGVAFLIYQLPGA